MPVTRAELTARAAGFTLRHAVASTVVIGGSLVFSVVGYFGVLSWAVLAGAPIREPLALPLFLVLVLLTSALLVPALFLATASTELLAARLLGWPWPAQVPLSTAFLALVCLAASFALQGRGGESSALSPWSEAALATAFLLVPLGAYFWTLRSTDWVFGGAASLLRRMRAPRDGSRSRIVPVQERTEPSEGDGSAH